MTCELRSRPPVVVLATAPVRAPNKDNDSVHVVSAPDLSTALRIRDGLVDTWRRTGNDMAVRTILLEIAAHVRNTAQEARSNVTSANNLGIATPYRGVTYVGTPSGLQSLIADIVVVGVADGVRVTPLIPGGETSLREALKLPVHA